MIFKLYDVPKPLIEARTAIITVIKVITILKVKRKRT